MWPSARQLLAGLVTTALTCCSAPPAGTPRVTRTTPEVRENGELAFRVEARKQGRVTGFRLTDGLLLANEESKPWLMARSGSVTELPSFSLPSPRNGRPGDMGVFGASTSLLMTRNAIDSTRHAWDSPDCDVYKRTTGGWEHLLGTDDSACLEAFEAPAGCVLGLFGDSFRQTMSERILRGAIRCPADQVPPVLKLIFPDEARPNYLAMTVLRAHGLPDGGVVAVFGYNRMFVDPAHSDAPPALVAWPRRGPARIWNLPLDALDTASSWRVKDDGMDIIPRRAGFSVVAQLVSTDKSERAWVATCAESCKVRPLPFAGPIASIGFLDGGDALLAVREDSTNLGIWADGTKGFARLGAVAAPATASLIGPWGSKSRDVWIGVSVDPAGEAGGASVAIYRGLPRR
jgi:hypothetical protein